MLSKPISTCDLNEVSFALKIIPSMKRSTCPGRSKVPIFISVRSKNFLNYLIMKVEFCYKSMWWLVNRAF